MRVVKVLNTSVVLALDEQGEEVILMGKGIRFRKTIGASLDADATDKVFVLRDRDLKRTIIQLAAELNGEIFGLTKEIIDYAKDTYSMQLMDHIYLALTDHLAFAIQRVQEGISFPGFYSMDVMRYRPEEYDVGCYAVRGIRQTLGVELPESEICNIAFHFINAQKDHPYNGNIQKMEEIARGILELVKYYFGIVYNQETIAYSRFVTHVQALAQRVALDQQIPEEITDSLYDEIVPKCPEEFKCVNRVAAFLDAQYQIQITQQEKLYLTIHIHRVLEENRHTGR